MLCISADVGLRRWAGQLCVGLPPCRPMDVHLLEGAYLIFEVVRRLASDGPMTMVAAVEGVV